jgi:hypothetical protein
MFSYSAQVVADNDILLANGGRGIEDFLTSNSSVYFTHITAWGNNNDPSLAVAPVCGEIQISTASNTQSYDNLAVTASTTGCNGQLIYALSVYDGDPTDQMYKNFAFGTGGQNTAIYNSGAFAYGPNNTLGTNPNFASPVAPGAPSCGSFSSVPACMATVIANFTPTNAAASSYGYQIPSASSVYDPLFPQWLCNVNLPVGLVTMGCEDAP